MPDPLLQRLVASVQSASPMGTLADDTADLRLCIVAPSHPWLCAWLHDALGLTPGDAVMVTLPGGVSRDERGDLDASVVRGVAAACFRHGCREVLLLALPGSMSPGDSSALVEAFRGRGVNRDEIPSSDLRGYLGLVDDPRSWLPRAARALRDAGPTPTDLAVHTGIIDPRTGQLQILETGYEQAGASNESPDPMGLGPAGPVALAVAALDPYHQRAELDAAHQRAIRPTEHVVDFESLDHSHREAALAHAHSTLPVGAVVEPFSPPSSGPRPASGPVVLAEPVAPLAAAPRPTAPRPSPPPTRRRTPSPRPPPAPSRSGRHSGGSVDLDAPVVQVGDLRLDPDLIEAMRVVRDFYRANFDESDRAAMLSAATEALGSGVGIEVGLRVVIQPVIRLGPVRYQVLNELLAVKGGLTKLPLKISLVLLRALLA